MKKVSLLLMTYNCADNLKKTLATIDKQDYPSIEVCIADSCSNDGTVEVIKEYAQNQIQKNRDGENFKEVKWISKKDSGIYEGLNNSIALATGDYLQVMNDEFTQSCAVSKLVKAIEDKDTCSNPDNVLGAHSDLIYASDGKVVRSWKMGDGNLRSGWMPAHPTLLLKREVYEKYGLYNTSYVSAADYEFMVRILKEGKNSLGYVPETLVSMFYGGTSSAGIYNYWRSMTESLRALKENHIHFRLWVIFLRFIKVALQFK